MPHLQIRDCPEDIYRKITSAAKRQNRTTSEQALVILKKGLNQEESDQLLQPDLAEQVDSPAVPLA
jgi:hypothetical protein